MDRSHTPSEPEITCGPLRERMLRFERYLPKVLTRWIMGEGSTAQMAPVERDVTVMFTDIAGFTAMAEERSATAIAAFLNDHFGLLAGAVKSAGGVIDKFLGDGVLAFWLTTDSPDDADRAARAALAIASAITRDNDQRESKGEDRIRMRIGLQTGTAVVGSIGAGDHMTFTIIGDTVNMAQRLEQLAKTTPTNGRDVTILLGAALADRLTGAFQMTRVGYVPLEGRHRSVEAYRLEAEKNAARPTIRGDEPLPFEAPSRRSRYARTPPM